MPFTFAHPAIVLPLPKLFKRYVSATGLVMGSIAPDFEYFLRLEPISYFSHTLAGILYFNLPVAVLLSFLFHLVIRNPLIEHLPDELYYRFHPYKKVRWVAYVKDNFLIVLGSVIIGALSHLVWDSFTHPGGFFVRLFPELNDKVWVFPLYRIIQHGSTLLGFAVMGWYVLRMRKIYVKRASKGIKPYWLVVGLITFALIGIQIISGFFPLRLGVFVVAIINGVMAGLFLSSLFYRKMKHI